MKRHIARLAGIAALLMTSSAYALDLELANEMYLVVSVGQATVVQTPMQIDNNNILRRSTSNLSGLNSTQSSAKHGAKLQLGYAFNPNFAIEGGYVDLGKTTYEATYATQPGFLIPGTHLTYLGPRTNGKASREAKITGWNISGLGIYPINETMSVFGKMGMIRAQIKTTDGGGLSAADDTNEAKWKVTYGLGGNYTFNENIGVRLEFERFSKLGSAETTGSADVNLLSLGMIGRF